MALAISEPFHPKAPGVSNAAGFVNMTQKATGHIRLNMAVGTAGEGYLILSPTAANDAPLIYATNSSFGGNSSTLLTANNVFAAGWSNPIYCANLPYSASDLCPTSGTANPPCQSRVVAVAIRITYSGPVLSRGGFYYMLTDPTHNGLAGISLAEIGTFKEAQVVPITENCEELTIHPINASEDHFPDSESTVSVNWTQASIYPFSSGDTQFPTTFRGPTVYTKTIGAGGINASANIGSPPMVIGIQSSAGATFIVEVVIHVEYVGSKPAPMATPNYPDHVGAQLVKHAASQLTHRVMNNRRKSRRSHMMEALQSVAKYAAPMALTALEGVIA